MTATTVLIAIASTMLLCCVVALVRECVYKWANHLAQRDELNPPGDYEI